MIETNVEAQPLWLSYKQSQSITGLSRGVIFGLVSSGKIEAAKVGARVLISRACYELGRKSHRNADSTVGLVPSRSPFPAFLSRF